MTPGKAVIGLLLVLLLAPMAQAESIRVVTEIWPPYCKVKDDMTCGIVTEVVRATLDKAGLEYTIDPLPWARAYKTARSQQNVLIYPIFQLPNRLDYFQWIKIDGLDVEMALFRPKYRTDIRITELSQALKYRTGVTRETSTHHYLLSKGFIEGTNLFPVNSEEQNAMKSSPLAQRIDLSTGDVLSMAYWLKSMDLPSDYWVKQITLFQRPLFMAFGHDTDARLVDKVRRAFEQIQAEGRVESILNRYRELLKVQVLTEDPTERAQ